MASRTIVTSGQASLFSLLGVMCVGVAYGSTDANLEVLGSFKVVASLGTQSEESVLLAGRVTDEAGIPVVAALVARRLDGTPFHWNHCSNAETQAPGPPVNEVALKVQPDGEFCVRLTPASAAIELRARAPHFIDLTFVAKAQSLVSLPTPQIVAHPDWIDLDSTESNTVDVLAGTKDQTLPEGTSLELGLHCRDSELRMITKIAIARTRLAKFEFLLPGDISPGACHLVTTIRSPGLAPTQDRRPIAIRAQVIIAVKELTIIDNTAFITIQAQSSAGPVSRGLIEAQDGQSQPTGTPVVDGQAVVQAPLARNESKLTLSYVPSDGTLLASAKLSATLPATIEKKNEYILHIFGLLVFCAWLAYTWLKPQRHKQPTIETTSPSQEARIEHLGMKTGHIEGTVRDAHTGRPIDNASILLHRPTSKTLELLESVRSNQDGFFQLRARFEEHPLLNIELSGDDHMTFRASVKSPSVVIHLTERRRATIKNLISWTRKRGVPWTKHDPATPGDVVASAKIQQENEIISWANAIAQAAYSRDSPTEETVDALKDPPKPD